MSCWPVAQHVRRDWWTHDEELTVFAPTTMKVTFVAPPEEKHSVRKRIHMSSLCTFQFSQLYIFVTAVNLYPWRAS